MAEERDIDALILDFDDLRESLQEVGDQLVAAADEGQKDAVQEYIDGLLEFFDGAIDDSKKILVKYKPTVAELNKCLETRAALEAELAGMTSVASLGPESPPSSPLPPLPPLPKTPTRASPTRVSPTRVSPTRATPRKVRVTPSARTRVAPPARTSCKDRNEADCVVAGEINPCHWHDNTCMTGTAYKKAMGIKARPAAGQPAAGSKKALTDSIKRLYPAKGYTLQSFSDVLKQLYSGKTLSRLTLAELGQVLNDLETNQFPIIEYV